MGEVIRRESVPGETDRRSDCRELVCKTPGFRRPQLRRRSPGRTEPDWAAGLVVRRRDAESRRADRTHCGDRSGGRAVIERTTLYATSDGRYLTGWELGRLVTAGDWTKHLADRSSGTVLVEDREGTVIGLTRLAASDRPDWLELRSNGTGVWVADRRRTLPPGRTGRCAIDSPNAAVVRALAAPKRW